MALEKLGGSSGFGDTWNPSADADKNRRETADPNKDYIEGFLIDKDTKRFASNLNDSEIYTFEIAAHPGTEYTGFGTENGKVSVFGCAVLDDKMKEAIGKYGMGCWLRIEYQGMVLKKASKAVKEKFPNKVMENKDYVKLFDVIGDPDIPVRKVAGQTKYESAPTPAAPSAPANPELPASLGDELPSKDEIPDDLDLG